MYEYKIKEIVKMYDGDTITVFVDLGFNTTRLEVLRLARINAPEIRGEERSAGLASREYLIERLEAAVNMHKNITIKTYKDHKGKYGRYIADVFVDGVCINDEMVNEGFAEYVNY